MRAKPTIHVLAMEKGKLRDSPSIIKDELYEETFYVVIHYPSFDANNGC